MLQPRLLERISNLEREEEPYSPAPATNVIQSIISHLSRLLNTRQGSVAIAPDYGVPDMTNIPGDSIMDTRQQVENIIEGVVLKYEPRLQNIKMIMQHDDKDDFSLKFRLEANLAEREEVPVVFETVVTTDGQINISP